MNRFAVLVVLVVLLASLVGCSSDGDDGATLLPAGEATATPSPSATPTAAVTPDPAATDLETSPRVGRAVIVDSFDTVGPEALPAHEFEWGAAIGSWAAERGVARVVSPASEGGVPALVIAGTQTADGLVQVTMSQVTNGSGLAFRLKTAANYWALVAAPPFATWNLVKVVEGEAETVGNVGVAPVAAGTTIGVMLDGDDIRVMIDGRVRLTLSDRTHNDGTWIGLVAQGGPVTEARWDDVLVMAAAAPGS